MQPANNAVIQAPALSVSPVQIALRIKKPLWKSGAHSCRNLSCVRRRFNRKNKPGGIKRGRSFPKASSAGKSVPPPLDKGWLTVLWNRKTWKPAKRNYPSQQPARIRRRPSDRNAGSGDGKNAHCQLPPLRLFPASTNQHPQRAADGTWANAPLFFPGGLSSGIQVGPHHHGMRKRLRLHYGKV